MKDLQKEPSSKKPVHLTSAMNAEVAEKIERVSKEIFEKNRKAYRILANK